jgi:hypothetical protein
MGGTPDFMAPEVFNFEDIELKTGWSINTIKMISTKCLFRSMVAWSSFLHSPLWRFPFSW